MKVLITIPSLKLLGGVSNYYLGFKQYLKDKVKYITIGTRGKPGLGLFWLFIDIPVFILNLIFFHPNLVIFNPSININALKRDFLFQIISKLLGFKTSFFIHGFNLENFEKYNKNWLSNNFNKASFILVLSSEFRRRLKNINVRIPIELTNTKVDDKMLKDFVFSSININEGDILYLGRVEKEKGIYETIETFLLLKKNNPDLTLNIVGTGSELPNITELIKNKNIKGIKLSGRAEGKELIEVFKNARMLILLSYSEGMPTSVLEGMAFGLPIITRRVGGLIDFFENGKMGFISDSLDPKTYAKAIQYFINNPDLSKKISKYNYEYAKSHFMASTTAGNLRQIFYKYS